MMRNPIQKLSMQKRMMLYFAVPLILVQIILCFLCYPQVIRRYREKTDYTVEQSINQTISFTESYLQNMTYLADMVENSWVIQDTLSAKDFGGNRPYFDQWLEYYELNREFNSYELSNSIYRFCLYVPDDVIYSGNHYFFFENSRLKERSDYVDLRYTLNQGEDYVALSQERSGIDKQETSQMVTLYHRIVSKEAKDQEIGICSISVSVSCFQDIMQNANITSKGLVYLMSENGRLIASSSSTILQKMQRSGGILSYGPEISMEKKKEGQMEYYAVRRNVNGAAWQMISMIPKSEYEDQYRILWLSAILMMGGMIVVIVMISYVLSGYYVGRLKKLKSEMAGLQNGNLNANLPLETEGDEIEEIYHNFNGMVQEVQRLMQEHYKLGKEVKMAEVRALQAQINPHFLYNTLESINWRAKAVNNREISLMTESLGFFLRATLSNKKSLVTLSYELNLILSYITIQQIRFEERLDYREQVPDGLKNALIPPLTLQPLVENAIHYALEEMTETCYITILAAETDKTGKNGERCIRISVTNSGSSFDEDLLELLKQHKKQPSRSGIGLLNIDKRIKLLFGEDYGLSLFNQEDCAVASITIPYRTEETVSC